MNKFEIKGFECELLASLYFELESKKRWYMTYNHDTEQYEESEDSIDREKCSIIEDLMKKLEKML